MRSSLREAHRGVTEDLRAAQSRSVNLPRRISADYAQAYQQHGQRFMGILGSDEKFELKAVWKQREITRYSKTVGKALTETIGKDREKWSAKLAAEETRVKAERAAGRRAPTLANVRQEAAQKWVEHLQYKQKQLDEIMEARAAMEAETDILVHSGLVDPEKDRVMYFSGSPDPCPLCVEVQAGNPYTVEQSRAIGGTIHPGCRDSFYALGREPQARNVGLPDTLKKHLAQQWKTGQSQVAVAGQKVRDGSVTLWTGQSLTPAAGRAVDKERELRPMKDLWGRIPGYVARVNAKQPGIPGG